MACISSRIIPAMDETAAAATARALAGAGIERVFGLPGGEILVLMDELRRAGVDFVLMRHEANAGIAAAVYGKLRRQPGVVLTTLGPGAANLMLPLANACLDQEPLLAISAQIPDDYPSSHTHQLLPLHDVYRPVTRLAATITAANASDVVSRALAACMTRPFGTAYLTLSAREALKRRDGAEPGGAGDDGSGPPNLRALSRGDAGETARQLTALLANAKRPLVLLGLGIDPVNAARIRQMDERLAPACRRHAEGEGDRRRDQSDLRRRRRRHGRRRPDVRGDRSGRSAHRVRISIRSRSTRRGTPSCRSTGCSKRPTSAASCRPGSRSSTTRRCSTA